MRVHHVWSESSDQVHERMNHSRIGDRRMPWPDRIDVEAVEQAAPAGNPVDRDTPIRFGSGATAPGKRRDLDDVASPLEFMREHLHVEVSPAWGRRVAVGSQKNAH
jgi:hypothetical protein